MQLTNYVITMIWEIVLPNNLFKRLFPFSIIFYLEVELSVVSLWMWRTQHNNLKSEHVRNWWSFRMYRGMWMLFAMQVSCVMNCLHCTRIYIQWDSVWHIAYQNSSRHKLCNISSPVHHYATISKTIVPHCSPINGTRSFWKIRLGQAM